MSSMCLTKVIEIILWLFRLSRTIIIALLKKWAFEEQSQIIAKEAVVD
jgi:hypothetical protein